MPFVQILCAVAFIVAFFSHWIYRWRNPKCNGILPPGSSGLPLIGETLELIISPTRKHFDIAPFFKKRLQRHGTLFRTNVNGLNVVVSADQEFNHYIIQQEGKLVMRWFLGLFAKLFKEPNSQIIHKYVKKLMKHHFGVECIKQSLLSQFDELVRRKFKTWVNQDSVEMKSAGVAMFGELGAKLLFSYDREKSRELTRLYVEISKSLMAFPLNLPGTTYRKGLQDKQKVLNMLRDVVHAILASSPENMPDDFLSEMVNDMKATDMFTDEFITQLLFNLQFATSDSLAGTLTSCVKLISENPDVLQELIVEHDEVLKKKENPDSPVTWDDYKSMTFTHNVLNEAMRMSNILPGMLRRVIKDITVNGYTIPEGWGVLICHSAMHFDPTIFPDPLKFNPHRWDDRTEIMCKNFMPFGAGIKQCSGAEFAKASMCLFLHVLITKYRWTVLKGGELFQNPIQHHKNGLHIKMYERTT